MSETRWYDYKLTPQQIMERKEFFTFGCGACGNHVLGKNRSAYVCRLDVKGHPDMNELNCKFFVKRHKTWKKEKK